MLETGVSRKLAHDIYNRKVLTGLRSWQPWALSVCGFAAFLVLAFTPFLESLGVVRDSLAAGSLILGVLGGFAVCEWLAYPAMVDAAEELGRKSAESHARPLVVDPRSK
jgi:hypothetical protein